MKNAAQKILGISTAVIASSAFAHEGHGSGAMHDMQHSLWLAAAIFVVAFVYKLSTYRSTDNNADKHRDKD